MISTLNQETVLMVPEQANLTERLLLTVTAADARHNERSIEELAVVWRDLIRLTLSSALAESELLESYAAPWLVPQIATWLGMMLVLVIISGWFRAGCRWWEHRLRRHLRDLQRDLAAESELDTQPVNPDLDATTADLDATDADPANLKTTHLGTTAPNATAADSQTSDAKNADAQTSDSQTSDSQSANCQKSAEVSEHRGRAMTHPAAVALPSHPPRVNKLGKLKSLDQDRTNQNQKDQNQKDQDRRDQDQRQAANGQTLANGQVLGRGQGSGLGQEQLGQEAVARAKGARRASPPISPPRMWGSRWGQRWARSRQQSQALSQNLGQQVHELVNAISHRNLHRQGWLSQQRNLVQLLALVLRWFQIWVILYGFGEIIFLFPSLRLYSHLLIPVAIRIPILWMVIGFADKTVDFICDAALNRWARRSSLNDPSSQRYPLRVSTYSPAIHGATTFVANCIGSYFTIRMLNINPAGLASIGAVAVAATFLSRNLIEGILNGTLILWTDRYAVGDAVEIQGEVGIVEDMNLYLTVVRGREGRAIAIPNGQISTVANLSKDWSRVDLRVAIDHEADVEMAKAIIMDISEQLHADPDWGEKVIDPAIIMGVDDLSHFGVTLLIWMKTQPLQHWSVGREFRLRIKKAFAEHNIALAMPRQVVYYQSSQFPSGLADGDDAGITALDVD